MQENKEASGFNVLQLGVSLQRIARGGMWILTQTKYMIVKGLPRSVSFQYETCIPQVWGMGQILR